MAVKAKFLAPSITALAPTPEPTAAELRAEHNEELKRATLEQLSQRRVDLIEAMKRFGKGAARWDEAGWGWVEPDWEAHPDTWPPVAKMLWLFDRAVTLNFSTGLLRHLSSPEWCPDCLPAKPDGYHMAICVEHQHRGGVAALAKDLFGSAAVTNAPEDWRAS